MLLGDLNTEEWPQGLFDCLFSLHQAMIFRTWFRNGQENGTKGETYEYDHLLTGYYNGQVRLGVRYVVIFLYVQF